MDDYTKIQIIYFQKSLDYLETCIKILYQEKEINFNAKRFFVRPKFKSQFYLDNNKQIKDEFRVLDKIFLMPEFSQFFETNVRSTVHIDKYIQYANESRIWLAKLLENLMFPSQELNNGGQNKTINKEKKFEDGKSRKKKSNIKLSKKKLAKTYVNYYVFSSKKIKEPTSKELSKIEASTTSWFRIKRDKVFWVEVNEYLKKNRKNLTPEQLSRWEHLKSFCNAFAIRLVDEFNGESYLKLTKRNFDENIINRNSISQEITAVYNQFETDLT